MGVCEGVTGGVGEGVRVGREVEVELAGAVGVAGQSGGALDNPENRTLLQVTVEDAAAADLTFDMLMGEAVPPRRRFIQTHAREVRNLDI